MTAAPISLERPSGRSLLARVARDQGVKPHVLRAALDQLEGAGAVEPVRDGRHVRVWERPA